MMNYAKENVVQWKAETLIPPGFEKSGKSEGGKSGSGGGASKEQTT